MINPYPSQTDFLPFTELLKGNPYLSHRPLNPDDLFFFDFSRANEDQTHGQSNLNQDRLASDRPRFSSGGSSSGAGPELLFSSFQPEESGRAGETVNPLASPISFSSKLKPQPLILSPVSRDEENYLYNPAPTLFRPHTPGPEPIDFQNSGLISSEIPFNRTTESPNTVFSHRQNTSLENPSNQVIEDPNPVFAHKLFPPSENLYNQITEDPDPVLTQRPFTASESPFNHSSGSPNLTPTPTHSNLPLLTPISNDLDITSPAVEISTPIQAYSRPLSPTNQVAEFHPIPLPPSDPQGEKAVLEIPQSKILNSEGLRYTEVMERLTRLMAPQPSMSLSPEFPFFRIGPV